MQGTWENGRFVLASTKDAQIAALREERDRLAGELAELRKPDCRTCEWYIARDVECGLHDGENECINGDCYQRAEPMRLYENTALLAAPKPKGECT